MAIMLLAALIILGKIDVQAFRQRVEEPAVIERAALAGDA
jgi:hypothetical protein